MGNSTVTKLPIGDVDRWTYPQLVPYEIGPW